MHSFNLTQKLDHANLETINQITDENQKGGNLTSNSITHFAAELDEKSLSDEANIPESSLSFEIHNQESLSEEDYWNEFNISVNMTGEERMANQDRSMNC